MNANDGGPRPRKRPTALMTFVAQTLVHAGAGSGDEVIDLPIQREAATRWPVVFGSGVKGALRDDCEDKAGSRPAGCAAVKVCFGPDKAGRDTGYGGALGIGDLQILLLPVRSLSSRFRLVTSPDVLRRYRDHRARLRLPAAPAMPELESATIQALVGTQVAAGAPVFLEDHLVSTWTSELVDEWIEHLGAIEGVWSAARETMMIVDDDSFRRLAESATHKATRVELGDRKTVKTGALWLEEALVPQTTMYAPLEADAPLLGSPADVAGLRTASAVLAWLKRQYRAHPYLRVGGNESLGQGWGRVGFLQGGKP